MNAGVKDAHAQRDILMRPTHLPSRASAMLLWRRLRAKPPFVGAEGGGLLEKQP